MPDVYTYVCIWICIHMAVYGCVYICMYMDMYTYVCTKSYVHRIPLSPVLKTKLYSVTCKEPA
jgi:hypothetical protein